MNTSGANQIAYDGNVFGTAKTTAAITRLSTRVSRIHSSSVRR